MMEIANTAVKMTLAVLMTLSGAFHQGLKSFEAGDFEKAVEQLSVVIEKETPDNPFYEQALLYRAKAYVELDKPEAARKDFGTLAVHSSEETLKQEALKAYVELKGDPAELLPDDTPKKAMERVMNAIAEQDLDKVLENITGDLLSQYRLSSEVFEGEGMTMQRALNEISEELTFVSERIGKDEAWGKAYLTMTMRGRQNFEFELVAQDGKWIFSTLSEFTNPRRRHPAAVRGASNVMITLKQIGIAYRMYTVDHNTPPPELKALVENRYLQDGALLQWLDPESGTRQDFLYYAGNEANNGSTTMIVATPQPVDGKRFAVFADGHVEQMSEKAFTAAALKQKWKLPSLVKIEDVDKDVRQEVEQLVKQLGDSNYKKRTAARKKLADMGMDALPVLEKYRNHSDPEIRLTIEELIEQ